MEAEEEAGEEAEAAGEEPEAGEAAGEEGKAMDGEGEGGARGAQGSGASSRREWALQCAALGVLLRLRSQSTPLALQELAEVCREAFVCRKRRLQPLPPTRGGAWLLEVWRHLTLPCSAPPEYDCQPPGPDCARQALLTRLADLGGTEALVAMVGPLEPSDGKAVYSALCGGGGASLRVASQSTVPGLIQLAAVWAGAAAPHRDIASRALRVGWAPQAAGTFLVTRSQGGGCASGAAELQLTFPHGYWLRGAGDPLALTSLTVSGPACPLVANPFAFIGELHVVLVVLRGSAQGTREYTCKAWASRPPNAEPELTLAHLAPADGTAEFGMCYSCFRVRRLRSRDLHTLQARCTGCTGRVDAAVDATSRSHKRPRQRSAAAGREEGHARGVRRPRHSAGTPDEACSWCTVLDKQARFVAVPSRLTHELRLGRGMRTYCLVAAQDDEWFCGGCNLHGLAYVAPAPTPAPARGRPRRPRAHAAHAPLARLSARNGLRSCQHVRLARMALPRAASDRSSSWGALLSEVDHGEMAACLARRVAPEFLRQRRGLLHLPASCKPGARIRIADSRGEQYEFMVPACCSSFLWVALPAVSPERGEAVSPDRGEADGSGGIGAAGGWLGLLARRELPSAPSERQAWEWITQKEDNALTRDLNSQCNADDLRGYVSALRELGVKVVLVGKQPKKGGMEYCRKWLVAARQRVKEVQQVLDSYVPAEHCSVLDEGAVADEVRTAPSPPLYLTLPLHEPITGNSRTRGQRHTSGLVVTEFPPDTRRRAFAPSECSVQLCPRRTTELGGGRTTDRQPAS